MYQYKTKDGSDIMIPGVGVTVDGHITSTRPIENPNLELIKKDTNSTEQPPAEESAPEAPEDVQVPADNNKGDEN